VIASRLAVAGHDAHIVCLPEEVEAIRTHGLRVRFPIQGSSAIVEIDSARASGEVRACGPRDIEVEAYDLCVLAMQEPHYRAPAVGSLVMRAARASLPCLSITGVPPPPYLRRLRTIEVERTLAAFSDPRLWDGFDPGCIAQCRFAARVVRPERQSPNVLQVSEPGDLIVTEFEAPAHTQLIQAIARDVNSVRLLAAQGPVELPVRMRVAASLGTPLTGWPMWLTGEYRCVFEGGVRTIREAVHGDIEASRSIYRFVAGLCMRLGCQSSDIVPFEKYAMGVESLSRASAVARLLQDGAAHVERVDKLVQAVAASHNAGHPALDALVALIDARLTANRSVKLKFS
jgi:hypothetical protein